MTVAQNIEYGLRVRRVPKAERRERAAARSRWSGCPGSGPRKPAQLSGGQRQRVALARAIINEPQVLLLDEPLGALDLKLRQEMQLELQHVQREVGITFVYVTHDQEEALSMSDRIAVLHLGRIEQVGHPGRGVRAAADGFRRRFHRRLQPDRARRQADHRAAGEDQPARRRRASPSGCARGDRAIRDVIYAGVLTRYVVDLDAGGELVVARQNEKSVCRLCTRLTKPGEIVRIAWRTEQAFTISHGQDSTRSRGGRVRIADLCAREKLPEDHRRLGRSTRAAAAAGCGSSTRRRHGAALQPARCRLQTCRCSSRSARARAQLNLIAWEGYLQPEWVKPFEKQTGCQVHATVRRHLRRDGRAHEERRRRPVRHGLLVRATPISGSSTRAMHARSTSTSSRAGRSSSRHSSPRRSTRSMACTTACPCNGDLTCSCTTRRTSRLPRRRGASSTTRSTPAQ